MTASRNTPGSGRARERAIERSLLGCAWISVVTTAAILVILVGHTAEFFAEVPVSAFLLDDEWTPRFAEKHFGIWPLVAGTVLTSAIAMIVAVPLGLLSAIYLAEMAPPRLRALLKPTLELLAGVPTIVYGYFALVTLTPLLQRFLPELAGFNSLSAGIVMGVMIVPLVASLSEDAIRAVPGTLREAAYALGAGRLATIFRVVLPTAASGIAASLVLAGSRAIGETMIVAIAAGQQPRLTLDPQVPIETMTAYIVQVTLGNAATGSIEYLTIFVVGASLFAITFVANLSSQRLARRLRRRR
jgi:phosphate transport system permease protein